MTGFRLSLQEAERLAHRVRNQPVQLKDLAANASGKDNSRHLPPRETSAEISTKLIQRHRLLPFDLLKSVLNGGESCGIREDLGGLLQRVVLVDGDEHRCWPPSPSDDDVFAEIGDPIDYGGEIAAERCYWDDFGHAASVPYRVHFGPPGGPWCTGWIVEHEGLSEEGVGWLVECS